MQQQLDVTASQRQIAILGVNGIEGAAATDTMIAARTLTLLKATASDNVWQLWQVAYRDVVVVGPSNERLFTFNLSANNLSDSDNYALLKNQLLDSANVRE